MFHTYVRRLAGGEIDLDRAQFPTDKDLAVQAADFANDRVKAGRSKGDSNKNQIFVDAYCHLHNKKYGVRFRPNVGPDWSWRSFRDLDACWWWTSRIACPLPRA